METRSLLIECLADAFRAALRGVVWGLLAVASIALLYPVTASAQLVGPPAVDGAVWLGDVYPGELPEEITIPGDGTGVYILFACTDGPQGCLDLGESTGVVYVGWLAGVFGTDVTDYNLSWWIVELVEEPPPPDPGASAAQVAADTLVAAQAAASSAEVSAAAAVEVAQLAGVLFWVACTGLGFFGYSVGSKDV